MKVLDLKTSDRSELLDITSRVEQVVEDKKIKDGICIVFCPHTTAGLTINENADPSVKKDIINHLKKVVPEEKSFMHSEGNSDAHIKASMMGNSLNIIIKNGELVLGTWQGIYFCEFDGPRSRKVYIKVL